ncbi:hypothetical protein LUZ61_007819 [Rhynchospora tenuis]|uniref:RRM domain-containing protein n=1 Tax=Rhynchospora tenuis TaxID=198213 RepID=A0AAD5ZUE2_9POAL|nr:hypothetical protein LUZ61_007819 [Rhynchospora tenuis]
MTSVSSQQFRLTQPPSKVIHLRNLPWECTPEELIEFGKPFGKVINTKCNVGTNKNQAFIEFADTNQAMAMISYYSTATEPAQIRGKTVYLQYSNRGEITNSKTTGEVPSNVLLVTLEGVQTGDVSIDVLHLVFSAFGFVHKITTFEKTHGFQALIQFTDTETATSARDALDGRSIPSYLIEEHVGPVNLKITYSAHTDLTVKFQSHRSRDYTNPYLPVAPSAIDGTGQDGQKGEPPSNVLLASIENMQYAVTVDVLHTVFSAFGTVQKIALFEKSSGLQALIQYPDTQTAMMAKDALEGHPIYEGGYCKLHLTYSRHTTLNVKINNDRGRDYTGGNASPPSNNQPSILGPQPLAAGPLYTSPSPTDVVQPPGPTSPNQVYVSPTAAPPGVEQFQYLPPPPGVAPYFPGSQMSPPGVVPQHLPGSQVPPPGVVPQQFPGSQVLPPGVAPQQFPGSQVPPAGVVPQQFHASQVPPQPHAMQFPGAGGQQVPFTPQPPRPYNY